MPQAVQKKRKLSPHGDTVAGWTERRQAGGGGRLVAVWLQAMF